MCCSNPADGSFHQRRYVPEDATMDIKTIRLVGLLSANSGHPNIDVSKGMSISSVLARSSKARKDLRPTGLYHLAR